MTQQPDPDLMDPQEAQALFIAGLSRHQTGDLEAAASLYREVISGFPAHTDALHMLGVSHYQRGQHQQAVDLIGQALRQNDSVAAYHCNLGNALKALGRLDEALTAFETALRLAPDHALAHSNRGNTLLQLNRPHEALAAYDVAVGLRPDYAEGHCNRSRALMALDRPAEAAAACEAALHLRPDLAEAYASLGGARRQMGQMQAALDAFDAALRLRPDQARTHCDRGAVLAALGRTEDALAALDTALHLQPDSAEAYCNQGFALMDANRPDAAMDAYRTAIRLQPDLAEAHFNLGMALLLQGNFASGWTEYDWRWRCSGWPGGSPRHQTLPPWRGEGPIAGQTLLLWSEQGLGDTLQFARYVPLVAALGGSVVLEVQPALAAMLAPVLSGPAVRVIATGDPVPPADRQCPLLSLPLALRTTLETIPPPLTPQADPDRAAAVRASLPPGRLRVGIVWQGNPHHHNDRNRSVPLSRFAPLAALPGITLVSLQKGAGTEQLAAIPPDFAVHSPGPDYDAGDFAETAATLLAVDLLITVDTAIAHLAGSLGRPAWVLLPAQPDWRWLTERDDSPWYPSLRLIRQPESGNWDSVFAQVIALIRQYS